MRGPGWGQTLFSSLDIARTEQQTGRRQPPAHPDSLDNIYTTLICKSPQGQNATGY